MHEGEDKGRRTLIGDRKRNVSVTKRRNAHVMDPLNKPNLFLLRKRGAKCVLAHCNILYILYV